ncbi:hypothetical protein ALQ88_03764 [Pseudomonas savastanoi]|nr:hypothetical protein ALO58_200105 [Pseudomonas savastanoi pv. savastanoi]RML85284.1 hypothetical protein ALQ88_03764 [Pseudomonas savastanoi]
MIRPANDVYYLALEERYRSVRRFLPDLLKHIRFGFSPAGKGVAASLDWLQLNLTRRKPEDDAPQEIVAKAWQQHISREDGSPNPYTYATVVSARFANWKAQSPHFWHCEMPSRLATFGTLREKIF